MPRRRHAHDDTQEQAPETQARQPATAQALIDPYAVLGLPRKASLEDVKKAYFARVREFPPERDPDMFKKIRAAYEMLRTPEAKAATDLFLPHPPVPYGGIKRPLVYNLEFQPGDWAVLLVAFSDLGRVDFRSEYREVEV
jgi:curved DNA-binding protein CbpA